MFGEIFYFIGIVSIGAIMTRHLRKEKNSTIENEDIWEYMCIGEFIVFFILFFSLTNIAIYEESYINSSINAIKYTTIIISLLVFCICIGIIFNIEKITPKKININNKIYVLLLVIVVLTLIQGILGGEVYYCYMQIIGKPKNNIISEMFFMFSLYTISLISSYLLVVQILIVYDTEEYKRKHYFILLEPTAYTLIQNSNQAIEGTNPVLGSICKENDEYILLQTNNGEKLYISKQHVISKKCVETISLIN